MCVSVCVCKFLCVQRSATDYGYFRLHKKSQKVKIPPEQVKFVSAFLQFSTQASHQTLIINFKVVHSGVLLVIDLIRCVCGSFNNKSFLCLAQ